MQLPIHQEAFCFTYFNFLANNFRCIAGEPIYNEGHLAFVLLLLTGISTCIGKCGKDDVDWILENSMLADAAVIVAAPVYHIRTNGYLLCISEKINHFFTRKPPPSEMKKRSAAISVGGTGYDGWTSLGLPLMQLFLQHFSIVVDQIQINHCSEIGAALTPDNEWAIERCKQLGRNVVKAMDMPVEKVKYMGEDNGVSCPICHCNIL
jgi:hypothetical protein